MRVSLVIGLLDGLEGGTEQHLLALCGGLPKRGFEVEVACVFDHPFLATRPLPVPTFALCSGRALAWRVEAPWRLARGWRRSRPGAALAFFDNAQFAAVVAARWAGGGVKVLSARRNMGSERRPRDLRWVRWTDRGVSRLVCNSEAVRSAAVAAEGFPARRAELLYNGVPTSPVRPQGWRERAGVPADAPLVGCISGLRPVKTPEVLLRAFAQLSSRLPQSHLAWVGDGVERGRLEALARELGVAQRVHFVGWLSEPRPLLAECDVCALASGSEGFSNAVLEYMAAGRPAVVTRVGGNAEAVRDGVDGFVVEAGNVPAVAGRLAQLLGDPELRRRMGEAAAQRARAEFDQERMLDRMAEIFREVAE